MSTKELQKKLKELGKSSKGFRSELIKRYDREVQNEEGVGEWARGKELILDATAEVACVGEPYDGDGGRGYWQQIQESC